MRLPLMMSFVPGDDLQDGPQRPTALRECLGNHFKVLVRKRPEGRKQMTAGGSQRLLDFDD